ncbi:MAG: FtsX-like permease family protein [Candidatus Electrothrix aestuarii]|uniref:FtsX-like permease family protein n=1 Tax=Candidatus Electrothrix aestuarii TaxID=3062594 RepID=A0AAU8M027_9BACT
MKMALRNIAAYKKRTIVTVLLTSLTTALLVFASAWMDGSHQTMIKNAVEIYPGYLQITGKEFRDKPSYEHLIFDSTAIREKLADMEGIALLAARFESFVLYSADEKAVGGMLTGIEPEKEAGLSRLSASLQSGEYLSAEDTNQVYIGNELAKRLKVGIGDEIAFVGNGADYSFAADNLIVKGIFQTGLYEFDTSTAFLNLAYFEKIMAATNYATHFIVMPEHPEEVQALAAEIGTALGKEYAAESWRQIMAQLLKAMQMDSIFGYITLGIFFIVIFFVITIYTLLTVYSRIREIGVLRAIGTTPKQILGMLMLESALLAVVSVVLGGLLGGVVAYYFHLNPIPMSGFEEQFKQYGLAVSAIPTAFQPLAILRDMLVMFVLSVLSTLYPILKINRYRPVEAMRHV